MKRGFECLCGMHTMEGNLLPTTRGAEHLSTEKNKSLYFSLAPLSLCLFPCYSPSSSISLSTDFSRFDMGCFDIRDKNKTKKTKKSSSTSNPHHTISRHRISPSPPPFSPLLAALRQVESVQQTLLRGCRKHELPSGIHFQRQRSPPGKRQHLRRKHAFQSSCPRSRSAVRFGRRPHLLCSARGRTGGKRGGIGVLL